MRYVAAFLWLLPIAAMAEEPALPLGLSGSNNEPPLPLGLNLQDDSASVIAENKTRWKDDLPFTLSGFVEGRAGIRTQHDLHEKEASIGELRAQFSAEKATDNVTAKLTADLLYDPVLNDYHNDYEQGKGWLDLREASLLFRPTDNTDVKIGRQILTWGTGDLLFINDLFPKDWNAFFIGRDEDYLKAPSDSIKLSYYADYANIDIAYMPQFDSDRFIDGSRISYYNGNTGQLAGRNAIIEPDKRVNAFTEDEIALRLYRSIHSFETALYFYNGYWKSPEGQDNTGIGFYPRLSVYGASTRGPVAKGIGNAEFGYYDSRDDNHGNNPLIRNSEWRFLLGYEQELIPELTGAFQYYLEYMEDYDAYKASLSAGSFIKDHDRHVLTVRLTRLLMNQNLTLSLFNYYSPSDNDGYARPKMNYKFNDQWQGEIGGNIFYQDDRETFFGQLQDNSNLFVAMRYSF